MWLLTSKNSSCCLLMQAIASPWVTLRCVSCSSTACRSAIKRSVVSKSVNRAWPPVVFAIFCDIQAKAALQAKDKAHTKLTAVAQQQRDNNKAAQDQRQQAQAAQCSIADVQRQKHQGNSELQSLLSLFTGLGPSGQTAFCHQLATAEA